MSQNQTENTYDYYNLICTKQNASAYAIKNAEKKEETLRPL